MTTEPQFRFFEPTQPEPETEPAYLVVWRERDVVDGYVRPIAVVDMRTREQTV